MTLQETLWMDQIIKDMEIDNESLVNEVSELREALKDIIKFNCLGKSKKIADRAETILGYRKSHKATIY